MLVLFKSPNDVHGECLCDAGGHILRRRTRSWRGSSALGSWGQNLLTTERIIVVPTSLFSSCGLTGLVAQGQMVTKDDSSPFVPSDFHRGRSCCTGFPLPHSGSKDHQHRGRPPSRPWPTFAAGTSFNVFLRLFSSAILTSSLSSKPLVACVTEEGEMTHEDAPWRKSQRVMLATASPMNSSHHDEELVGSSFPFTGCTWTCSDMHGDQNRKRKKAMISDGGPIGWGH